MVAWTTWRHLVAQPTDGHPWDLSWGGPWWVSAVTLPHVTPTLVLPVVVLPLALTYGLAIVLWDRMASTPSRSSPRSGRAHSSNAKIRFQSSFMRITVQPSFFASS